MFFSLSLQPSVTSEKTLGKKETPTYPTHLTGIQPKPNHPKKKKQKKHEAEAHQQKDPQIQKQTPFCFGRFAAPGSHPKWFWCILSISSGPFDLNQTRRRLKTKREKNWRSSDLWKILKIFSVHILVSENGKWFEKKTPSIVARTNNPKLISFRLSASSFR